MEILPIQLSALTGSLAPVRRHAPEARLDVPVLSAVEIPPELVKIYSSFIGSRLQSEINRTSVNVRRRRDRAKETLWQTQWTQYLFGEEQDESEEGKEPIEFWGEQLRQGNINDCFLVAAFYAVLQNPRFGKQWFAEMIEPLELFVSAKSSDGEIVFEPRTVFNIVFPGHPEAILIDPFELMVKEQVKGGAGFRILERAFAKLSQKLSLACFRASKRLDDTLSSINGGGYMANALKALTGDKVRIAYKEGEELADAEYKRHLEKLLAQVRQNPERYMLLVATDGEKGGYRDLERRFANWHAFTIQVSRRLGQLIVVNPWDTKKHRYPVTEAELLEYFCDLAWVELPVD